MQLKQGQIWKQGAEYIRIVKWERLAIEYKVTDSPDSTDGALQNLSKKEFCRLLKGASLYEPVKKPTEDVETP